MLYSKYHKDYYGKADEPKKETKVKAKVAKKQTTKKKAEKKVLDYDADTFIMDGKDESPTED